jgi:hypothetical protein
MPSLSSTEYLKSGDTLPLFQARLRDGEGHPVAFVAGDTVVFKCRARSTSDGVTFGGDAHIVKLDVGVNDPDCGKVEYQLPLDAVLPPGTYEGEWTATFSGGRQATYPNRGYDLILIGTRLSAKRAGMTGLIESSTPTR